MQTRKNFSVTKAEIIMHYFSQQIGSFISPLNCRQLHHLQEVSAGNENDLTPWLSEDLIKNKKLKCHREYCLKIYFKKIIQKSLSILQLVNFFVDLSKIQVEKSTVVLCSPRNLENYATFTTSKLYNGKLYVLNGFFFL